MLMLVRENNQVIDGEFFDEIQRFAAAAGDVFLVPDGGGGVLLGHVIEGPFDAVSVAVFQRPDDLPSPADPLTVLAPQPRRRRADPAGPVPARHVGRVPVPRRHRRPCGGRTGRLAPGPRTPPVPEDATVRRSLPRGLMAGTPRISTDR